MKLKIQFTREIDIKDIMISNYARLDDKALTSILHEIRDQIQPYFPEKIGVRERLNDELQFCEYCQKPFNNMKGLKMHYSIAHDISYDLYLSAHRAESTRKRFIYFYLENPESEEYRNQTVLRLAFQKKTNEEH